MFTFDSDVYGGRGEGVVGVDDGYDAQHAQYRQLRPPVKNHKQRPQPMHPKEDVSKRTQRDSSPINHLQNQLHQQHQILEQPPRRSLYKNGNFQSPLILGLSPGTTGTHTHFSSTCRLGLPSVHHATFCVSRYQGSAGTAANNNVDEDIMKGLQSHINILELNTLAYRCARGFISKNESSTFYKMKDDPRCQMPIQRWESETKGNITTLLGSGIVGLFDYPYPNMAAYILEMLPKIRGEEFEPTIVYTKRSAAQWAGSRIKHGFLLCREDYKSIKRQVENRVQGTDDTSSPYLSEFDIFECIRRAVVRHDNSNGKKHLSISDVFYFAQTPRNPKTGKRMTNHIRDHSPGVFRALRDSMQWHQEKYSGMAKFAPDFFGVDAQDEVGGDSKIEMEDSVDKEEEKYKVNHATNSDISFENGSNEAVADDDKLDKDDDDSESESNDTAINLVAAAKAKKKRLSSMEVAEQLRSVLKEQGYHRTDGASSQTKISKDQHLSCIGQFTFTKPYGRCFRARYGGNASTCFERNGSGKKIGKRKERTDEGYRPIGDKECYDWDRKRKQS